MFYKNYLKFYSYIYLNFNRRSLLSADIGYKNSNIITHGSKASLLCSLAYTRT